MVDVRLNHIKIQLKHSLIMNRLFQLTIISSAIASLLFFANETSAKNVGLIQCSGIQDNGRPPMKYPIQQATLEKSGNSYKLIMTVKGWGNKGSIGGDRVAYPVARDLKIYGIEYYGNSDTKSDTVLSIERNGKFGFTTLPSSRAICLAKGTLNFGQGVKRMLFK
jgi:hypothetical protein